MNEPSWDERIIFRKKRVLKPELPEDVVMALMRVNPHLKQFIEHFNLDLET